MFGPFSAPRDTEKPAPKQTAAPLPSWNLGFGSCFGAIHGLNDQNMGKTASSHSTLKRCRSTITSSFGAWRLGSATDECLLLGWRMAGRMLNIAPCRIWESHQDAVDKYVPKHPFGAQTCLSESQVLFLCIARYKIPPKLINWFTHAYFIYTLSSVTVIWVKHKRTDKGK